VTFSPVGEARSFLDALERRTQILSANSKNKASALDSGEALLMNSLDGACLDWNGLCIIIEGVTCFGLFVEHAEGSLGTRYQSQVTLRMCRGPSMDGRPAAAAVLHVVKEGAGFRVLPTRRWAPLRFAVSR